MGSASRSAATASRLCACASGEPRVASLSDVVRVRYYVTKPEYFEAVAPVLAEHLGGVNPAATMIVCQLIRPEMLIEIEVTAQVG